MNFCFPDLHVYKTKGDTYGEIVFGRSGTDVSCKTIRLPRHGRKSSMELRQESEFDLTNFLNFSQP